MRNDMNRKSLKILALLSGALSSSATIMAAPHDIIVPEPLYYGYAYSHYPFARLDYEDEKCFYVDVWGAGVHRSANSAFINKDSTQKESIAGIFFGADTFTIAQAFAPGTVFPNPLVLITQFTPTFDFNEDVAFFGANVEIPLGCDDQWHIGFRTRVPFRSNKVALDSCCDLQSISSVTDLYQVLANEYDFDQNYDGSNAQTPSPGTEGSIPGPFAYRLDLVSLLHNNANSSATSDLVMQYGAVPLTIGGVNVTQANGSPIHVIERSNGTPPLYPQVASFSLRGNADVNGAGIGSVNGLDDNTPAAPSPLPFLAANGSGLANNARARFQSTTNYTPLSTNIAQQAQLWIVPTLQGTVAGDDDFAIANEAAGVVNAITRGIANLANDPSVVDLLLADGVTFNTQRRNGIGDFDLEFYGRYDSCGRCWWDNWFAEGIVGARFPTDTRLTNTTDVGKLLLLPTGSGHYEVKIAGYVGWNPCAWFAVKADAFYFWVIRRTENLPAPFTGATIKGIGPVVEGQVSWQYFVGDLDFTFLIPCGNSFIGFDVGYQAWVKRKDHVSLDVTTAVDFTGATQPLDASILENRTHRIAHVIKTEIFKQTSNWQIFAGWNHAFAGENALNNSDWYLGLEIYF